MAFALVQQQEGTWVTTGLSMTATFPGNHTAGNLLVAIVTRSGSTFQNFGLNSVQSVSDGTNKWKCVTESVWNGFNSAAYGLDIWCCESAVGGSNPTVTVQLVGFPLGNVTTMNVWLAEYSGASGYELVDGYGAAISSSVTPSVSTGYATTQAADLVISAVNAGGGTSPTIPSGWTSRLADAVLTGFYIADNLPGSTGIQTATWGNVHSVNIGVPLIIAAFRATGATSGPNLLQSVLYEAGVGAVNQPTFPISSFPVNPAPGNALFALVTGARYHNVNGLGHFFTGTVTGVTDTAGNTWVKICEEGIDTNQGNNAALFMCASALGGATSLTAAYSPTVDTPFAVLWEMAHVGVSPVLDRTNSLNRQNQGAVSSIAKVSAGDVGVFYGYGWLQATSTPVSTPPIPGAGWLNVVSDTTGVNLIQYQPATAGAVLTGTLGAVPFIGNGGGMVAAVNRRLLPGIAVH